MMSSKKQCTIDAKKGETRFAQKHPRRMELMDPLKDEDEKTKNKDKDRKSSGQLVDK